MKEEIFVCVMIAGVNNNENARIERNLNSVFTQNYTNYKAVIIDDASTDGSVEIYKKYLEFYSIDKKYYTLIANKKSVKSMANHFFGMLFHCPVNSITLTLDADDELIGRNIFQVFNEQYFTRKSGVLYSENYRYAPDTVFKKGHNSEYTKY